MSTGLKKVEDMGGRFLYPNYLLIIGPFQDPDRRCLIDRRIKFTKNIFVSVLRIFFLQSTTSLALQLLEGKPENLSRRTSMNLNPSFFQESQSSKFNPKKLSDAIKNFEEGQLLLHRNKNPTMTMIFRHRRM